MNRINYVKIMFSLFASNMFLMSSLINTVEPYLPGTFKRLFRYGKFAYQESSLPLVEVPKAWFKHFYVLSAITSVTSLILAINVYVFNLNPPNWIQSVLNETVGSTRSASVSSACVLLALILLALQCVRRFYDTHFVSIFSKSYMNFIHYAVGLLHYVGVFLAILGEAPGFSKEDENVRLLLSDIKIIDIGAAGAFLWAWYHQYKATVILADLRKNKKGRTVTEEHKIPQGDLFEYVTSPHMFTEKLMYVCLTVILWGNSTWFYIVVWVLVNQFESAMLNYWWYQEKFEDFPKKRKALIPFIF